MLAKSQVQGLGCRVLEFRLQNPLKDFYPKLLYVFDASEPPIPKP